MKYYHLFLLTCLFACQNKTPSLPKASADSTVTNDTIPELRQTVNKKPVATYVVSVNDPKLERTFGVSIYETPFTFKYLMRMHYETMEERDTLELPNFGVWPEVQIRQGKDKRTCIIGFLDKNKAFAEYKMLTAKGNEMKLVTLKKYAVGRYRTVHKKEH